MKRINAIDLDKTLIPYDSFRRLVVAQLRGYRFDVLYITLLRMLRILDQESFKKKITLWLEENFDEEFFLHYAQKLYRDMDKKVLQEVQDATDENSLNVLISASPDLYVKPLVEMIGWQGKGSFMEKNDKFVHLYGGNKVQWILKNFPKVEYEYYMAISDSDTDDELLELFKKKIKWISP